MLFNLLTTTHIRLDNLSWQINRGSEKKVKFSMRLTLDSDPGPLDSVLQLWGASGNTGTGSLILRSKNWLALGS